MMDRRKSIYRVTLWGGAVNVLLLAFKFVAGIVGHSAAMVADAVHSLSDFVTDIIVLAFVHISGKPKDKSHDYGHGKYETLALTIIGLMLLAVSVGIVDGGLVKIVAWMRAEQLPAPGMLALLAALLSIVLKEGVFHYTIVKARELESQALDTKINRLPMAVAPSHKPWQIPCRCFGATFDTNESPSGEMNSSATVRKK